MNVGFDIAGISKAYHRDGETNIVLRDVSFHIGKGEFVCIIGPSGCGKTSFLNIVAGIERATSGQIRFNGLDRDKSRPKIGMVFQTFALLPWRDLRGNVEYGLEIEGVPRSERHEISQTYFELLGLNGYQHMYPKQLSSGMKQRVAIARALSVQPDLVVMDEPFAAIDQVSAEVLQEEISEIHQERPDTFLLATHNISEAIQLGDRIVLLTSRPARVKTIVPVDLSYPRSRSNREFVQIHREILRLFKEELENTLVRHKIR